MFYYVFQKTLKSVTMVMIPLLGVLCKTADGVSIVQCSAGEARSPAGKIQRSSPQRTGAAKTRVAAAGRAGEFI